MLSNKIITILIGIALTNFAFSNDF